MCKLGPEVDPVLVARLLEQYQLPVVGPQRRVASQAIADSGRAAVSSIVAAAAEVDNNKWRMLERILRDSQDQSLVRLVAARRWTLTRAQWPNGGWTGT
jgi:hypothetical protein